jgi:hypothetical protein
VDRSSSEKSYLRLLDKLESLREMLRVTWALEGLGLTAAIFLGIMLVGFALDNLFWLPTGVRIVLLLAGVSSALALLAWRIVRPLARKVSDERAAVVLEKSCPELDNEVINAVQLGKDRLDGYSRLVADEVVKDAEQRISAAQLPRAVEKRNLKRYLTAAGVLLAAVALYVVLFPAYFANAFQRYSTFSAYVPPITRTVIKVEPGNITLRSGEDLSITCTPSGEIPDSAEVQFGEGQRLSMQFDGGKFIYRLPDVTEKLKYIVYAGDARSPEFNVDIIYVPTIDSMAVTYRYPEYTGLGAKTIENATGDLEAVEGSVADVRAVCSKPVSLATLQLDRIISQVESDGTAVKWEIPVTVSGTYTVRLVDRSGYDNSFTYQVTALKDGPPRVVITKPGRDVTYAANKGVQQLTISFRATDDVGVRECALFVADGTAEPERRRGWTYEPGCRDRAGGYSWDIDTGAMKVGTTLSYFVIASDGRPGEENMAVSKTYRISIVKPREKNEEFKETLSEVHTMLRDLLRLQVRNRDRTVSLTAQLSDTGRADDTALRALDRVQRDQRKVRESAQEIAAGVSSENEFERKVRETLLTLEANEMLEAVREIEKALKADVCDRRIEALAGATRYEEKIIETLQKLLQDIADIVKQLRSGEGETVELPDEDLNLKKDFAKNLLDGLEEFLKEQKKIIKDSEELEKKAVEDWTEGDEKTLAELAQLEQDWSKWFKDMADDLSRLPNQDMSDSKMAKELIEIFEEVELAADALTRRDIELAVPREQAGAEMAEELTENIERWLPDVRDYIKWVMEDVPEDQEIPLADLPDELEDIIGELIEEEEQLSEDADDASSAWADSLNKGAGWGASDGPISNMSAKGVTGNTLPNTNEVGGRSGEGRSGKSSGQMVEETATGKGGRKTPTRLTPDPYEAGSVKDLSKDPVGGSTGGGKLSGGGEDGLRGPTAPQIQEQMQRLARQQAQIVSKSERLAHNLKKAQLPSEDLELAAGIMQQAEECLKNGDLNGFAEKKKVAVENLEDAKRVVAAETRAKREQVLAIPKDMREELINAQKERFPEKYRGLLSDYYRALSNPGSNGKEEDK